MIKIVKRINESLVEIESDNGKYLDIGNGPVKKMHVNPDEIEYVIEVSDEGLINNK